MYMGVVQAALQQNNNSWMGDLYLPFCTTKKMDWILDINFVTYTGRQYQARVEFTIKND